jgi:hypothetical protein
MESLNHWAEVEFGQTALGDKRRTARLVQLAQVLGEHPASSLPNAAGNPATLKAAYRFFDNEAVEAAEMLRSHVAATYQRLAAVTRVLAVQDTTYLDWTAHPATHGLGPLATKNYQGLLAHSTLAFTVDRVPLGLLAQRVWAREAETYGQLPDHKTRTIDAKESHKWLESLAALGVARAACPDTQFVSVGDREADLYDLFVAARPPGVDLLVRAAMDRRVDQEEKYLWAALEATPVAATIQVQVPPRESRPGRVAIVDVHWRTVTLCPPGKRRSEKLSSVSLWAVWAVEPAPPPDVPAVEWLLLTTVPILTVTDALERLEWYGCRWGIEVWHKVLKSGCQIEARQLETAERLTRCLTLYAVIAWRILYATMLARTVPDLPATALLEEAEWQALFCVIQHTPVPSATPPPLAQAVRWIAQLGGFQNRKLDGPPGVTVLWKGFQQLADLTRMYRILRPESDTQNVGKD